MHKAEHTGMKRLPLKLIGALRRPIDGIPQKRMSDGGHVDADLMCPAGLKPAFNMGEIVESLKHTVMGHGLLSVLMIDSHFFAILGVPADGCIHRSLLILKHAMDDSLIPPCDAVLF